MKVVMFLLIVFGTVFANVVLDGVVVKVIPASAGFWSSEPERAVIQVGEERYVIPTDVAVVGDSVQIENFIFNSYKINKIYKTEKPLAK